MKPCKDFVLIKPVTPPEKSEGGIFYPIRDKEQSIMGIVVAISDGLRTPSGAKIKPIVEVGSKVMFPGGDWKEIKDEETGETYLLIKEDCLLCQVMESDV